MSEPKEFSECEISPLQLLREKMREEIRKEILEELSKQDFVHVIRCKNCEKFKESQVYGWCERYDEPKTSKSFCSEVIRKQKKGE